MGLQCHLQRQETTFGREQGIAPKFCVACTCWCGREVTGELEETRAGRTQAAGGKDEDQLVKEPMIQCQEREQ